MKAVKGVSAGRSGLAVTSCLW